jgi:hypothetical protein
LHQHIKQPTDSRLGIGLLLKLDNAGPTRAAIGLILNFSTLDLADRGEKLDKIFIAGGPRKLGESVT